MQVLKKYAQLIDFVKIFNKYNDANTIVDISDEDYELLTNFVSLLNLDPTYIPETPQAEVGDKGPTGDKGPQGDKGEQGDKGPQGDAGQIDANIITSNVNGLQINVVDTMPENPDENTLYIIQ